MNMTRMALMAIGALLTSSPILFAQATSESALVGSTLISANVFLVNVLLARSVQLLPPSVDFSSPAPP